MKKLLGIMLCVFTLMLGGCANITADYVIDYLDEIETEGMSARGLDIKDKFDPSLKALAMVADSTGVEFDDTDILGLAQILALLTYAQVDLEDYEYQLNKTDLKVLNDLSQKAEVILAIIEVKYSDELDAAVDILLNEPDDIFINNEWLLEEMINGIVNHTLSNRE